MNTQARSDGELAVAARAGNETSFSLLMHRHKNWLYRFIRRYVSDSDDAYDVLQDSFVSAWSALQRYDAERSFEAWLRRIALNKCRDSARRNAVRHAAMRIFSATGLSPCESATPVPDATHASDRALKNLEAAVANLPRQLKEPLVLAMLEGLSHREVSEILGINTKAVETRVYRAKKKLAAVLSPSDLNDLLLPD